MVEYTRVIDVAMDQHKVTINILHYVLLLVVCVHACSRSRACATDKRSIMNTQGDIRGGILSEVDNDRGTLCIHRQFRL